MAAGQLMDETYIIHLVRQALLVVLLVSAPAVVASLVVGLIVNLFQATTQLQDQTLTFVPKLLAVLLALAVAGPWIGSELARFCELAWRGIALVR